MTDRRAKVTDRTIEMTDRRAEVTDRTIEVTDRRAEVKDRTIEMTDRTSFRAHPTCPWETSLIKLKTVTRDNTSS